MNIRTSPTLPIDHGRTGKSHYDIAALMRETDDWVHVGDYATRKTAASVASNVRSGKYSGYRSRRYEARPLTTADGTHQVWGRYIGEATR